MRRITIFTMLTAAGLATASLGQSSQDKSGSLTSPLKRVGCTRVMDPKLDDGKARIAYRLTPADSPYQVDVTVWQDATQVATVSSGPQSGSFAPIFERWNGQDDAGRFVDPGDYVVRIQAQRGGTWSIDEPVRIVRLGITEIEAQSSEGTNEWQMVYFMKRKNYRFYATPEIHEYLNIADTGEISDLDFDDGSPRTSVPVHDETDEPVLELNSSGDAYKYDNDRYNYPICYAKGEQPQLEITLGDNCTSSAGTQIGVGYPVEDYKIRVAARDGDGDWVSSNGDLQPGGTATFLGPRLPGKVTRTEREVTWTFEYARQGSDRWHRIPGRIKTDHRFYTNQGPPLWNPNADGVEYSGPWVEVAQYFHTWQLGLGIEPSNPARVVENMMKGYFGQAGSLPTAIEDVHYDCPSEGGDGGANHYYRTSSHATDLTRLLNKHDNGPFVNCSDVASTSSGMLAMLGIEDMEMLRLGSMQLRCIWGVGTDDYTTDLWSNGNHGFSYHHIITRHHGSKVSDCCMWLDEDDDPDNTPGTPGENHDRKWGSSDNIPGYNELSSTNNTSRDRYDPPPKLY